MIKMIYVYIQKQKQNMSKNSKFNKKRGIVPDTRPKSILPPMSDRSFTIHRHTKIIPGLCNLIAEYASPTIRECIETYTERASTTVGDGVSLRPLIQCDQGAVDFAKHRGRKPKKRDFYAHPKIEFYVKCFRPGVEMFFLTKEVFTSSLETNFWRLPDNRKIAIDEKLMDAIRIWLANIF